MDKSTEDQIIEDIRKKTIDDIAEKGLRAIDLIDDIVPHRKLLFVSRLACDQIELGIMGVAITVCEATRQSDYTNADEFHARVAKTRAEFIEWVGRMFDECVARDAVIREREAGQ